MKTEITKPLAMLCSGMIILFALTIVFRIVAERTDSSFYFACYVTFLTIFYHFAMRIAAGEAITLIYRKRKFNYTSPWYKEKSFEKELYSILKVKKWKSQAITAKPYQFDVKERTYDELLHNMTQAEIVHETAMVLSFVPLFFIIPYGAPAVFIITSILSCTLDASFVIIQRYNRPRLLKIKKRMDKKEVIQV